MDKNQTYLNEKTFCQKHNQTLVVVESIIFIFFENNGTEIRLVCKHCILNVKEC